MRESGYETFFYPDSSRIGDDYELETRSGLERCDKVVVVGTSSYFDFATPTIREAEFREALASHRLILLRFHNAVLPRDAGKVVYQDFRRGSEGGDFAERVVAAVKGEQRLRAPRPLDFSRLPAWSKEREFVGRRDERDALSEALDDPKCSIICVIAESQRGKSSLVRVWLTEMQRRWATAPSCAPSGAFGYSFAGQGQDDSSPTAGRLFSEALSYFREARATDADPKAMAEALLEELNSEAKPLLILDGLEPHQRRTEPDLGAINDRALSWFLDAFITRAPGAKMIITSHVMPKNLEGYATDDRAVRTVSLGRLDHADSVLMLIDGGIRRKSPDIDTFARECQGEPLCLSLVGPAVANKTYDRQEFLAHVAEADRGGALHPAQFVQAFVASQLPRVGAAAAAVLYGASLFNESSLSGTTLKELLFERAHIPVLTAPLRTRGRFGLRRFSKAAFERAVALLHERRLITSDDLDRDGKTDTLSCELQLHPQVRDASRTLLEKTDRHAWRRANWTIYRALAKSVARFCPDNKADLQKLYMAVRFGVNAGRGPWAGWMYGLRCLRGYRAYSTNQHGMIGDDVELMAHYFQGDWQTLRNDIGLGPFERSIASSWAGLALIGTNRLGEGHPLMLQGLSAACGAKAYVLASRTARHLAFISSLLGRRNESLELARRSLELLERRRPPWIWLIDLPLIMMPHQRMSAHANLGCMLHYAGELVEAEQQFRRAEGFQAAATRYRWLRAIWGYRYADLLLDLGRFDEVEDRLEAALVDPDEPTGWGEGVFAAPLLRLGFVRLRIRQADHLGEQNDWDRVMAFAQSFRTFGEAERRDDIHELVPPSTRQGPKSILQLRQLARPKKQLRPNYKLRLDVLIPSFRTGLAGVARLSGELELAEREVAFAEKSAQAAGITLFSNEIAVERARILMARGRPHEALALLQRAREQNSKTSYRRQELERLAQHLSTDAIRQRA